MKYISLLLSLLVTLNVAAQIIENKGSVDILRG